jgi:hypothetical protein
MQLSPVQNSKLGDILIIETIKKGEQNMATCKECRWSRVDVGNPTKGLCISGRHEGSAEETTAGIAQSVIPGKMIGLRDSACDKFDAKPSRTQRIKEGI